MARQLRVGLTGGIGSGKSTVAKLLVERGAALVDTDAIAQQLTAPGGMALPTLRGEFGDFIFDAAGHLRRDRLRELVFSDPVQQGRLERILHPLIGEQARQQADAADAATIVFDVPLLAESLHWRGRCERIVVVDCREETQIRRVMARSAWAAEQVERVIRRQASRSVRRSIADAVIYNDDGLGLEALAFEVDTLLRLWCASVSAR